MVAIPGGTFLQGSPPQEHERQKDEGPQHRVTLSPFFMSKYEVTQAQWTALMGENPSYFQNKENLQTNDNYPVEQVSWYDASEFCARLSQRTGHIYRLPTESEWEYAARAGANETFAYGKMLSPEIVNYNGKYNMMSPCGLYRQKPTPVGQFPPNAWGLYDMHGNVWEWCQDWYNEKYYEQSPAHDPHGSIAGEFRIYRGGSWYSYAISCRVANRDHAAPQKNTYMIGFRVVRVAA